MLTNLERIRQNYLNTKRVFICMVQMVVVLAAMFLLAAPVHAASLNSWTTAASIQNKTQLHDVVYANGTYVAVGTGNILYSTNGENWYKATFPSDVTLRVLNGVAYGKDKFVAVGSSGVIYNSTDGITWTQKPSPLTATATDLNGIEFGGGKFIAVGASKSVLESTDGDTWQKVTTNGLAAANSTLKKVAYGNGRFAMIDYNASIWFSETGSVTNWTQKGSQLNGVGKDIAYGNGTFVATNGSGEAYRLEENGSEWVIAYDGLISKPIHGAAYGNGKFVCVASGGIIISSEDQGVSWDSSTSIPTTPVIYTLNAVTYGNGKYIAVCASGDIVISTDKALPGSGANYWTSETSGTTKVLNGIAKYSNTYTAVGESGYYFQSTNGGIKWNSSYLNSASEGLFAITSYNGTHIAVGGNGNIFKYTNGSWSNKTNDSYKYNLYGITNYNGTYVAVGDYGTALVSSDGGETWNRYSADAVNRALRGIINYNGTYVAVGDGGTITTSTDGQAWTPRTSNTTKNLYGITNYNGTYLAVGERGTILKSTNGSDWTSINSNTTKVLYSISNYNGTYIAVGDYGTIMTSTDGVNWTNMSKDTSKLLKAVIVEDGRYIILGDGGTVLTSGVTAPPIASASAILTSAASTTAGAISDIKLTLSDNTYTGAMSVTVKGYLGAPDGTFGSVTYPASASTTGSSILSATSTAISNVYFTSGSAVIQLQLNKAATQPDIQFSVSNVAVPDTNKVSITTVPDAAATLLLDRNVISPLTSGAIFVPSPKVTLKDKFGNICTNSTATIIATKKDGGAWDPVGATSAAVSSGSVTFDGLGATNTSTGAITTAQYSFSISGHAGGPTVDSSIFTILAPTITRDMTFDLTLPMPSGSNTITSSDVSSSIKNITINVANNTTSVTITGGKLSTQSLAKSGAAVGLVTINESSPTAPIFTIDTNSIKNGGSLSFTLTLSEPASLMLDRTYNVTVNIAQPNTGDMSLAIASATPSISGSSISVGGPTYTGNVNTANGTTSVVLTGHLAAGQSVVIGGDAASLVTVGEISTDPTFTINTAGISNGGSKTFTIRVKQSGMLDKVYTVTVVVANPPTADMSLELTSVTPSSTGNAISVGGSVYSGSVTLSNGTTSVKLTGHISAVQTVTIGGIDVSLITVGGTATDPTFTMNTSGISNGGIKSFTIIVKQTGMGDKVYNLNVTVLSLLTVTATSDAVQPTAGFGKAITLTVNNSFGSRDVTYTGLKKVTITGYLPAPNSSFGSAIYPMSGVTTGAAVLLGGTPVQTIINGVYFQNGQAVLYLTLNDAELQNLSFSVEGIALPATIGVTPAAAATKSLVFGAVVSGPATNGDLLRSMPMITLKDAFGNICKNDTTTKVYATNIGFWKLSGTTNKYAEPGTGIVVFDDLKASSTAAFPNAKLEFKASNLQKIYSNQFNIPAPGAVDAANGIDWNATTTGITGDLNGVTYGYTPTGTGVFVAVGLSGLIETSYDKIVWNKETNNVSSKTLNAVAYGEDSNNNGLFVAVGESATILISPDGKEWSKPGAVDNVGTASLYGVAYGTVSDNFGNPINMFIAVGANGTILKSTNGAVWTKCGSRSGTIYAIAYGGGKFLAAGSSGKAWESIDGENWSPCDSSEQRYYIRGIAYSQGNFYTVADEDNSIQCYSVDSESGLWSWTEVDQINIEGFNGYGLYDIEYNGNTLVAAGASGSIVKSTGGAIWQAQSSGTSSGLKSITNGKDAEGKDIFLAVGSDGVVVTSYITKKPEPPLNVTVTPGNLSAVISFGPPHFDGGTPITEYLVVNESGVPVASGRMGPITVGDLNNEVQYKFYVVAANMVGLSDYSEPVTVTPQAIWDKGIVWNGDTPVLEGTLYCITEGNGQYVTVGDGGLVLTSLTNTTSWEIENSGVRNVLYGVAYGGGMYVAVGESGQIITSTDGKEWVSRKSTGITYTLNAVAYGDGTFVAVGANGNILSSINGVDWVARKPAIYSLYGVAYGNGVFVAVGVNGTVLTSTDGLVWTPIGMNVGGYLKGVVYDNSRFVVVGDLGVILTSKDGVAWDKTDFEPQYNLNAVTYTKNNYIAVGAGGMILTSTDGTAWRQRSSGITDNLQGIVYLNGRFVAVGAGGILSTALVISPPSPPQNASAAVGNEKAILSFDLPKSNGGSPITGYEVINDMGQVLATGDSSPIILTGLSNKTTFILSVVAVNMEGKSLPSNQVYVSPSGNITTPGMPQSVTAIAGNRKALIIFTPPVSDGGSAITEYQITNKDTGKVIALGKGSPISVSLETNGIVYRLEVAAANIQGVGPGKEITVNPKDTITVPSSPAITSFTAGNGRVAISFDPPAATVDNPILRYDVYSSGTAIASTKESPVVVTGLTNNTTYTLAIAAVNVQGSSDLSNSIVVTPKAIVTKPDPPLNLSAIAGSGKATVSFTINSDGGSKITEYIFTDMNDMNLPLRTISASALTVVNGKASYTLQSLPGIGRNYELRVVARNEKGDSVPSNCIKLAPIVNGTAPNVLQNVSVSAGDGKAIISFNPPAILPNSPITSYEAFKDGLSIASSKNSPIIVTGLANDVCHTLTIAAVNIEGPGVPTTVQVTPSAVGAAPDPLKNLSVIPGNGKAMISFEMGSDGNSPISEFIVMRYDAEFNGTEFKRVSASAIDIAGGKGTILLNNLANGSEYKFRVVAVNGNSVGSLPSEEVTVKPLSTITISNPPRNLTYTLGNGKVFIGLDPGSNGGSPILEYKVYSGTQEIASGKQSPLVVEGLDNYKIYNLTVVARNIEGFSIPSQPITVKPIVAVTLPEPPKNIVASSGNGKAIIEFNAPDFDGGSPITEYIVIGSEGFEKASDSTSPVIVTGLANGLEYEFRVIAVNARGTSVPSSAVKVVPTAAAAVPDPPYDVVAKAGINKASISFTPGSDGGSRILTYIVSSDDKSILVSGSDSPIIIQGLTNNKSYKFNVVAINSEGMSIPSDPVSVTPIANAPTPDAPANISAVAGNGKAVISFDQGYNGGYAVTSYRVTNDDGTWSATISSAAVGVKRSLVVSGLTNGVEYKLRVIAVNSNLAESVPSAEVTVRPSASITKPGTPTNVSAVAGNSFIVVSFGKGSNGEMTEYKVALSNGVTVLTKDSPVTINGLSNGAIYTLTMSAINAEGESAPSAPITVQPTSGALTVSPPQNVVATAGNSKAIIGFDEPVSTGGSPIKEYRIINQYDQIVTSGTALRVPITVNGLVNGTQYRFRVVAVNGNSVQSAPSAEMVVKPTSNPSEPDSPENVIAIAGLNKAIICFNQGSNGGSVIKRYEIITTDGAIKAAVPISSVITSGNRRSLTVSGLDNDEEYTFKVVAVNEKGSSIPSAAVTVTPTSDTTVPSKPINLYATPANSSAVISFGLDSDGGLPLLRFVVKEEGGHPDTTINATGASIIGSRYFLTVPGLTNKQTYSFRVIAVNQNGDSLVSDPVSVTPSDKNIGGLTGYVKVMNTNRSGITVTIRNGNLVYTVQTDDNSKGKFEFKNIAAGTYSIEISKPGYITRTINNVVVQSLVVNISYELNPIDLIPGDVTGDNNVLYEDLVELMDVYNSIDTGAPDCRYRLSADFNDSKSINSIDLSVLMSSYNKTQNSYTPWEIPRQLQ